MWLTDTTFVAGCCAACAVVAVVAVAAATSVSISLRRLILPCSNSCSLTAVKASMAVLLLSPGVLALNRGELHLIIIGVEHIDAAAAWRAVHRFRAGGRQRRHQPLIVPVRDRVADMVNLRASGLLRHIAEIARYDKGAALARLRPESEIGAVLAVIVQYLHSEYGRIEIARLLIIGAGIGDVVDTQHLQSACRRGLGGIADAVNRGREGNCLAELASCDFSGLEIFHE